MVHSRALKDLKISNIEERIVKMKGMELCRRFFQEYGRPILEKRLGMTMQRIAVGRLGWGSDCIGADDELSRDHGWGTGFEIFLLEEDVEGGLQEKMYELAKELPKDFLGFQVRKVYIESINGFFNLRVGREQRPERPMDWLYCQESGLFDVTHGEVFYDGLGILTHRRDEFGQYYPHDVWLKRLSACCMWLYAYGELNFFRALRRKQYSVMHILLGRYLEELIQFIFLANKQYAPYWKWLHREFLNLLHLACEIEPYIQILVKNQRWDVRYETIEKTISLIKQWLKSEKLTRLPTERSLSEHSCDIHSSIEDAELRKLKPAIRYLGRE